MTTQVPYGAENAEYPRFASGHAQYPPVDHSSWTTEQAVHAVPLDAHPAPFGNRSANAGNGFGEQASELPYEKQPNERSQFEQPAFQTPIYPQQGGVAYPQPTPYPEPTIPQHHVPALPASPQPTAQPQTDTPGTVYPTSPPWATPGPAGVSSVKAEEEVQLRSYGQIGGLLVPYPEEMRNAARAQAPALWPVAVITFLLNALGLGIFGAVSASRRGKRARRGGNNSAPYWIAFVIALIASGFVWFVVGLTVVKPLVYNFIEARAVSAVENAVLHDGQLTKANITATAADCRAAGERQADGIRDYLCKLTLGDGRTGQLSVAADRDGHWKALQTQ